MNDPGRDSLSRWSRRKARARSGRPEAEPGDPPPATADTDATVAAPQDDAELLRTLELPDPDAMQPGDDFSAFLRSEVPERLRRRALRTLWRSDPVLANLDELLEYGEDYTDAATVVDNLKTAYRVGKGWLTDEEQEANRARIFGTDQTEEEVPPVPEPAATTEDEPEAAAARPLPEDDPPAPLPAPEEADPPPAMPTRRGMAFHFDDD